MSFLDRLLGRHGATPSPDDGAAAERALRGAPAAPGASAPDGGHAHRYAFAHDVLPRHVFLSPGGATRLLEEPDGRAELEHLWQMAGARLLGRGRGAPVAADGLRVDGVVLDGRPVGVVTLPAPDRVGEAYFAAVVPSDADDPRPSPASGVGGRPDAGPGGDPRDAADADGDVEPASAIPRYFLLERTADPAGDAVLCEWLPGRQRRNHGLYARPTRQAFAAAVAEQLRDEAERRAHGVPAVSAPTWRLGLDAPQTLVLREEGMRAQHCVFAFRVLPPALLARDAELVAAAEGGRDVAGAFASLWAEAGALCRAGGEPEHPFPGVGCAVTEHGGARWLVLRLPRPFSPPEPFFLGLRLGSERDRAPAGVYTLERAEHPSRSGPVLGRVTHDGTHAVLGDVDGTSDRAFLDAAAAAEAGRRLPNRRPALDQTMRYVRVAAVGRAASPR